MKEKTNFYTRIILCAACIAAWCFYFILPGKDLPKKNKKLNKITRHKVIRDKISLQQEKQTSNNKTKNQTLKTISVEKTVRIPVQKPVLNKKVLEPSKKAEQLLANSKQEDKIITINTKSKEIKVEKKPQEQAQTEPKIIKSEPKIISINTFKVAGATKELISKEAAKKNIQIPDQPLRKEIKVKNPIAEPVLKKLKEVKIDQPEEENIKQADAKPEDISPSVIDQIEVKGLVSDQAGESEVIITDKTNNHTQKLRIGDSYNGLRFIKTIDKEIYFKDISLNKIYKRTLGNN